MKEKIMNFFKGNKIKNQAAWKHGAYSVVITAVVLAAIVVLNVLLSALSDRVTLEYDMTSDKINTISEDNIKFIKGVEDEVKVMVCAKEAEYSTYVGYNGLKAYHETVYRDMEYNLAEDYSDYYEQTVSLVKKYAKLNKKIKVEFLDPQDASFIDVASKYDKVYYGDIIISCTKNNTERYKVLRAEDIYKLNVDKTYADMMGAIIYMEGNNIETALTGAISYVVSKDDKKIAFLSGHTSDTQYFNTFKEVLELNNYQVDIIEDRIISSVPNKYDAVCIVAPTSDFLEEEIVALNTFLENSGKYDKGLLYFPSPTGTYLSNFYELLEEWGISVDEGILFETNPSMYYAGKPTVLFSLGKSDDEILKGKNSCLTGYNIPILTIFDEANGKKVKTLTTTGFDTVNAPKGTSDSWTGAKDYEPMMYSTCVQSEHIKYDENSDKQSSYIFAFSSIEFITNSYDSLGVSNMELSLAAAERAVGAEDTGISFVPKVINDKSFNVAPAESTAKTIKNVFMIALPILCLAAGTFVYIRRKNA